jgi:hypothetical protein
MERTPTSRAAFGPDTSVVQGHKMPTHRQSQSQAIHLASQTRIHAVKALKDAFEMLGRNADAEIADTDFQK